MLVPTASSSDPATLARDEAWWQRVAEFYPRSPDAIVNLEHGYFGAMAAPVQTAYEDGIRQVNERLSPYVRGEFNRQQLDAVRGRLAALINAEPDEVLLTRSASESMQVLIGQYRNLKPGDVVLWCNLDYPALRDAMRWLEQRRGVTTIELRFELPITRDALLERYAAALRDTPNLKLILLSQVYPCNGQVAPVKEIVNMARTHGVDVLVDSAHALGQLPVDVRALQVDFAGFNLHKWIGAPLGLGFVFIRKSKLNRIEAHFGCSDYPENDIRGRLYAGTPTIGAVLAVPAALDFHASLGGAAIKAARLAWLRTYWVSQVMHLPGFRLFSPIDVDDGTALVSFGLDGMTAQELQQALLQRFGIFTVARSIGHGEIVRATVAITSRIDELDQFILALTTLAAR
jgi:isopenicillin-N epimerase